MRFANLIRSFSSALLLVLCAGGWSIQAAQGPSESFSSQRDPVAQAVVQLLAIGPGAGGNNRECSATGFLVSEEGYVLTNAHVVEDARLCLATSPGAKMMAKLAWPGSRAALAISCNLVGLDEVHDLALMKSERPPRDLLRSAEIVFASLDPSEAAAGTSVVVTGHPVFAWRSLTQRGKILRRETMRLSEASAETSEVILLDMALKPGNSGSPVYLQPGGAVVGVVERRNVSHPSETVAVPIRYAIELLNRYGVRWSGNSHR